MAGYDIDIDMDALRALGGDLSTIATEFDRAHGGAREAAEATGHDDLADHVSDFADKWNIKREKMLGNITTLQGIIQQITDSFTQVDADLAKALEEKAADTTVAPPVAT